MDNPILAYYQAMQDGTVTVGKWVRLAYEMIIKGLEDKSFFYSAKKANRAIKFIESYVHHQEGPKAPGLIQLELWQRAFIACVFGVLDSDGNRQFREILLEVGRKNGKTIFAAGIAEYCLFLDGEYGGRVYFCAPKLDQARLCYEAFYQNIKIEPELDLMCHKRRTDIYVAESNSSAQPMAFNARKSDGLNVSLAVCDEIAAWPGEQGIKQYEVIKSSFGARRQPILLSISTAGYENEGIFDELIRRATRILKGDSRERRFLPMLYTIDEIEKWNDLNELQKSNPNLGVSIKLDYMLEEIAVAEGSLSKKAEFITKYACIKQNSSQAWIDMETVNRCRGPELRLEDFKGCYCVGGIDLSMSTDLTACCVLIERDGIVNVFTKFFLPGAKIDEATARDGLPYRQYITRGILIESGENYVDYQDCYRWFVSLIEQYELYPLWVGYDKYSAQPLVQQMEGYGFHMDSVTQGENLTGIINTTEGMLKDGAINIGNNDLMAVHMLDAALKSNAETGRKKLIKLSPTAHVDGMAALLDAILVRQIHYDEIGEQLKNLG